MAVSINEAKLVGSIDQHEQITIANPTAAALQKNEVFCDRNAENLDVAYVAQGDIAVGGTGEACMAGEFDVAKATGHAFAPQDEVWWHASANEAIPRSAAKIGDFFFGFCTQAATSSCEWVRARLDKLPCCHSLSTSSSISVSVSSESDSSSSVSGSSSSVSTSSESSSSTSATSKSSSSSSVSRSSNSNSSSSTLSVSSLSDSSSSSSNSISSNSDSSSSVSQA